MWSDEDKVWTQSRVVRFSAIYWVFSGWAKRTRGSFDGTSTIFVCALADTNVLLTFGAAMILSRGVLRDS